MTVKDLASLADDISNTKRIQAEDIFKRIVRAVQVNGALTALQIAEVERIPAWDVMAAMTTLSEEGRLIHSHTTHTGEEAWRVRGE